MWPVLFSNVACDPGTWGVNSLLFVSLCSSKQEPHKASYLTLPFLHNAVSSLPPPPMRLTRRFGVSQTSTGSSRSSLENGGRERDRSSGSDDDDEDDSSQQNTSDAGRVIKSGRGCDCVFTRVTSDIKKNKNKKADKFPSVLVCSFPSQDQAGQQTSGTPKGRRRKPLQGGTARWRVQLRCRKPAGPTSPSSSLSLGEQLSRPLTSKWAKNKIC